MAETTEGIAEKQLVLDKKGVERILPHRVPMLLVDRVTEFDRENSQLTAELDITNFHCQGHFPGQPIFPGVHILEALAQASGLLLALLEGRGYDNEAIFLGGVDKVRWRRPVLPNDCLSLQVELRQGRGSAFKLSGKVLVNKQEVVTVKELLVLYQ